MKRTPKREAGAVYLLAGSIFIAGLLAVSLRYEGRITASRTRAEQFYRKTVANDRIAAQTDSLRRARASAVADLRRISKQTDAALSTADFIAAVQSDARRFGITVTEIEPQGASSASASDALQQSGVAIKLRGHFKALLRFVSDLPEHGTLVNVSDTQISLAPVARQTHRSPLLDAAVHATLFRLNGHHVPAV